MKSKIFYCPDCLEYKGSWVGLSSHLQGQCKRTKEIKLNQLIFAIIKTKEFLGEVPSVRQMNEKGAVSEGPIIDCFGSYNNALLKSDFSPENLKNISGEKMLGELKRVSKEHCGGGTPKVKDIQKFSRFSHQLFTENYGSWNKAVKEAGFTPNSVKNIEERELIEDLKRVSKRHCDGDIPRSKDIRKYGEYSLTTFRRRFGSWNKALKEGSFEVRKRGSWVPAGEEALWYDVRGADHPSWKGGYDGYYGPSWQSQRRKALKRDNYRCQSCYKSENYMGRKPDVHHIKPASRWDVEKEHEEMNGLDNLICLCSHCHRDLEGKWQETSSGNFISKARTR